MKVEIYDPAMCCSSGLCGPTIDPVLVKMNDAVLALKKQGIEIERFNLAQQPKEFITNKTVADLLHKNGKKNTADYNCEREGVQDGRISLV